MTDPDKPPAPPKAEHAAPKKAVAYYGIEVMEAIRRLLSPKEFFEEQRKKEDKP